MDIIGDSLVGLLAEISFTIDAIIFPMISGMYALFFEFAQAEFLNSSIISDITGSIFAIVGIIALFMITYTLLLNVINPDSKNKAGGFEIFKRIIIAFVAILVLPFVFDVLYGIQGAVLGQNVIGNLILGEEVQTEEFHQALEDSGITVNEYAGREFSLTVYNSFLRPKDYVNPEMVVADSEAAWICEVFDLNSGTGLILNAVTAATGFIVSGPLGLVILPTFIQGACSLLSETTEFTWSDANAMVIATGDYNLLRPFLENYTAGEMDYMMFISFIAGAFVLYMLALFTFDMAVRAIKLSLIQMIAPLPIFMSILPQNKDMLSNYIKKTLAIYFEIFIRVATMAIAVFIIDKIPSIISTFGSLSFIANIILIFAVLYFVKEMPKFIEELTGIKSGNMNLGLKGLSDRFTPGSKIGSIAKGGLIAGAKNWNTKEGNWWDKTKSAVAGGTSAGARTAKKNWSAKSFGDLKKGRLSAMSDAYAAKASRANKKARYLSKYGENKNAFQRGTLGRFEDAMYDFNNAIGRDVSYESLEKEQEFLKNSQAFIKGYEDKVDSAVARGTFSANENIFEEATGVKNVSLSGMKLHFSNLKEEKWETKLAAVREESGDPTLNEIQLKDASGTMQTIKSAEELAQFKAVYEDQIGHYERTLKKFIKTQYAEKDGYDRIVASLEGMDYATFLTLSDNEKIKMREQLKDKGAIRILEEGKQNLVDLESYTKENSAAYKNAREKIENLVSSGQSNMGEKEIVPIGEVAGPNSTLYDNIDQVKIGFESLTNSNMAELARKKREVESRKKEE